MTLQDYESSVDRYNSTLEDAGVPVTKKAEVFTLANAVDKEVGAVVRLYGENTHHQL